jgi:hypothetical protein
MLARSRPSFSHYLVLLSPDLYDVEGGVRNARDSLVMLAVNASCLDDG